MERTIIILIAAHCLGDFLLQPDWLARRKTQFWFVLLHGLIHAVTVYGLYQEWSNWMLPLAVLFVHSVIDIVKQKVTKDTARTFALDQGIHLVGLLIITWLFTDRGWMSSFNGYGYPFFVGVAGFVATVQGAGYFVGKAADNVKKQNGLEINGLLNGGAMIGNLERALIFLFIFIHEPAGIGLLVAAKSILRFEEAKKQKLAEYVLIGTLLSFSLAIAIASATQWAMKQ